MVLGTWPQPYPRMVYHPQGLERVVNPAEILSTPMGPKPVGEMKEIIHRVVNSKEEEEEWLGKGWHDHPAKAIAARGDEPPPTSSDTRIIDLEKQIAFLQTQLTSQKSMPKAPTKVE